MPWFAVGHMFTPMCKLWSVDQTGNVFGLKSFLSCPHSCENEACCHCSIFWHILLPVSQGLQANRLRELQCRHKKGIAELFLKGAAPSKQMVGLQKQG